MPHKLACLALASLTALVVGGCSSLPPAEKTLDATKDVTPKVLPASHSATDTARPSPSALKTSEP